MECLTDEWILLSQHTFWGSLLELAGAPQETVDRAKLQSTLQIRLESYSQSSVCVVMKLSEVMISSLNILNHYLLTIIQCGEVTAH